MRPRHRVDLHQRTGRGVEAWYRRGEGMEGRMMRTILVPVMADATDNATFATTLVAARQLDAHIEFLFVRSEPTLLYMAGAPGELGTWTSPAWISELEKDEAERVVRARHFCQSFCDRERIIVAEQPPGPHGMSAAWREEKGDDAWKIMRRTRFNDLLIVSPPREEQGLDPDAIASILIGSGRPVLLAPAQRPASLTRTVVIAWKETPEAARAVMAAMPFIAKADKVVVLSIGETDAESMASAESLA